MYFIVKKFVYNSFISFKSYLVLYKQLSQVDLSKGRSMRGEYEKNISIIPHPANSELCVSTTAT